jgi:hypothetical protein
MAHDFLSSHSLAIFLASFLPLRQVPLVLRMVKSMGCSVSIPKANSKGLILVGMFCGVVTKLYANPYDHQQCNYEILIQYLVHSLGLSIGLQMENGIKF